MGNCQASEAATVMIQHPCGKVERVYWSVRASEVMGSNPGHYVAVVVASATARSDDGSPLRQLKLLRPDVTLQIGHVYRLISFEEVMKEFASKKHVNLSRLLFTQQERGNNVGKKNNKSRGGKGGGGEGGVGSSSPPDQTPALVEEERRAGAEEEEEEEEDGELYRMATRIGGGVKRHGQWRPALQSIAEVGS